MAFKDLMKEMKGMNIQEMTKKAQLSFEMAQKTLEIVNAINKKMDNLVKMHKAYLDALESRKGLEELQHAEY